MTSPTACLAAAATTAVRRPAALQSLAAASTGKRALSIGAYASATTTTNSTGSNSQSQLLPSLEHRRHYYSSMPLSGRASIFVGEHSTASNINKNYYPLNNNITARRNNNNQQQLLSTRPFSSASKRDFYEVLGVGKGADKAEIKKSYFKLAKQYHPDTNQVSKANRCYACFSYDCCTDHFHFYFTIFQYLIIER